MPTGKEITIVLVPGLEPRIRELAHAMTIENIDTPNPSSVEELLSLLLPDLITNALAGDMTMPDPGPPDETIAERLQDIGTIIQEAERQAETPEVRETLVQQEPAANDGEKEVEAPTFAELCAMAEIHSEAVNWAKGNPSKEAALIETCVSLPTNMWSWKKVLELAERTYEMRAGGQKDDT